MSTQPWEAPKGNDQSVENRRMFQEALGDEGEAEDVWTMSDTLRSIASHENGDGERWKRNDSCG